jgi:hypothetical protein
MTPAHLKSVRQNHQPAWTQARGGARVSQNAAHIRWRFELVRRSLHAGKRVPLFETSLKSMPEMPGSRVNGTRDRRKQAWFKVICDMRSGKRDSSKNRSKTGGLGRLAIH